MCGFTIERQISRCWVLLPRYARRSRPLILPARLVLAGAPTARRSRDRLAYTCLVEISVREPLGRPKAPPERVEAAKRPHCPAVGALLTRRDPPLAPPPAERATLSDVSRRHSIAHGSRRRHFPLLPPGLNPIARHYPEFGSLHPFRASTPNAPTTSRRRDWRRRMRHWPCAPPPAAGRRTVADDWP